jgi:hypothetical protein
MKGFAIAEILQMSKQPLITRFQVPEEVFIFVNPLCGGIYDMKYLNSVEK